MQADLVDMQQFSKHNGSVKYIPVMLDILAMYAWAISLKGRTGDERARYTGSGWD